jgi:hypothetical protein
MSQANAAARKRRAGGTSMPGASDPVVQQQQTPAAGLTLPQVIALVDRRLVTLETFMKDTKAAPALAQQAQQAQQVLAPTQQVLAPTQQVDEEVLDEINNRFELLAGEVAELKDILIKLQSYTMEVNKRLVDERIQILSDVKDTGTMTFDIKPDNNIVLELSDDE